MYHRLKDRFGTAGVIVGVLALVAALGGTALAAKSALTGPQKQEVRKIAKQFAGKNGAPGAVGAVGPQGPRGEVGAGKTGAAGPQGAPGEDGNTILSGFTPLPADTLGEDGDFYLNTDDSELWGPKAGGTWAGTGPVSLQGIDGEPGSPWTAGGTLPSGSTETGTWSVTGPGDSEWGVMNAISFPVPLANEIPESNVHYVTAPDGDCTGSAANPTAAKGHLCVYEGFNEGGTFAAFFRPTDLEPGATRAGTLMAFAGGDNQLVSGTWAVTAP